MENTFKTSESLQISQSSQEEPGHLPVTPWATCQPPWPWADDALQGSVPASHAGECSLEGKQQQREQKNTATRGLLSSADDLHPGASLTHRLPQWIFVVKGGWQICLWGGKVWNVFGSSPYHLPFSLSTRRSLVASGGGCFGGSQAHKGWLLRPGNCWVQHRCLKISIPQGKKPPGWPVAAPGPPSNSIRQKFPDLLCASKANQEIKTGFFLCLLSLQNKVNWWLCVHQ